MVVVVAALAGYSTLLNRHVAANVRVLSDRSMPQLQAAADLAQATHGRAGRDFLARSLGWEMRLAQLRAQADGFTTEAATAVEEATATAA